MNYFEAQDLFSRLYPGKKITYEFDQNCHRFHELVYTDGKPNLVHHVQNNKVKVTVEGMDPIYVPIAPHRENCSWRYMKEMINAKTDIFISDAEKEEYEKLNSEDKSEVVKNWASMSGMSENDILAMVEDNR